MTDKEIKLAIKNGVAEKVYPKLVQDLIAEKYSFGDELSIQRQRDSKLNEFNTYNEFCEQCKAKAKEILGL